MAKRNKTDAKVAVSAAPLAHNPFAALAPTMSAAATSTPEIEPAKKPAPPKKAKAAKAPKEPAPKKKQPLVAASAEDTKNWGTKLVLAREKKGRGGKTVTRITGLPRARLEIVAKKMKKSLGCGASVDGDDVLLHGTLTERGAEWLSAQGAKRVVVGN
ncbi:MAG: translation initiation factor 1 [Polyangiales bacterium]|jgi:translation initiation factor 1